MQQEPQARRHRLQTLQCVLPPAVWRACAHGGARTCEVVLIHAACMHHGPTQEMLRNVRREKGVPTEEVPTEEITPEPG